MVINYQGDNYFKLQSGDTVCLINPTNQRSFKGAACALFSKWDGTPIPPEELFIVAHQGEYDLKGIAIQGWSNEHEKNIEHTVYRTLWDEIKIGIVLGTSHVPQGDASEELHESDILFVTVGESGFSSSHAARLVRSLEPSVVIPAFTDEKEKSLFLKEFGWKGTPEEKITVKKKDCAKGAMKIAVLQA